MSETLGIFFERDGRPEVLTRCPVMGEGPMFDDAGAVRLTPRDVAAALLQNPEALAEVLKAVLPSMGEITQILAQAMPTVSLPMCRFAAYALRKAMGVTE